MMIPCGVSCPPSGLGISHTWARCSGSGLLVSMQTMVSLTLPLRQTTPGSAGLGAGSCPVGPSHSMYSARLRAASSRTNVSSFRSRASDPGPNCLVMYWTRISFSSSLTISVVTSGIPCSPPSQPSGPAPNIRLMARRQPAAFFGPRL